MDVVKNVVKNDVKVFTKEGKNNIIKKIYNPLKVNYKLIYESEGLLMENKILSVVKELSNKYNKKEALLLKMIEKSLELGYNIQSSKNMISEFFEL